MVVDGVFTWDIESFVDLCFDVVSFVTALTEKFQKFISALLKIVICGADTLLLLLCSNTVTSRKLILEGET